MPLWLVSRESDGIGDRVIDGIRSGIVVANDAAAAKLAAAATDSRLPANYFDSAVLLNESFPTRLDGANQPFSSGSSEVAGNRDLSPRKDWRHRALQAYDSGGSAPLVAALTGAGNGPNLTIASQATRTVAVKIRGGSPDVMWSWVVTDAADHSATISYSYDSTDGVDGAWTDPAAISIYNATGSQHGDKFIVESDSKDRWAKIVFTNATGAANDLIITFMRLHMLYTNERLDYWVGIGASLAERAEHPKDLYDLVVAAYPDRDPVYFNRSVEGDYTDDTLAKAPGVLAEHPRASYVTHMPSGNIVTDQRALNGPSQTHIDTVDNDTRAVCVLIVAAGMIPIIGNMSFRDYATGIPVFNGRNPAVGSQPWNSGAVDAIRAEFSPDFDWNPYAYSRRRSQVLSADGIHWFVTDGEVRWREMLRDQVFKRVYTGVKEDNSVLPKHVVINFIGAAGSGAYAGNAFVTGSNTTLSGLVTVEGNPTGWSVSLGTINGASSTLGAVTGDNTGAFIDSFLVSYIFWNNGVTGTGNIDGLDPSKTYEITFMGSRATTTPTPRQVNYTIGGVTVSIADVIANTANVARFAAVKPDRNGRISFTIAGAATFGHLNAMEIREL